MVGACLLATAGTAAAEPRATAGKEASLVAVDLQPLVVRGTGFEPGERVRLVLNVGEGQLWRMKVAGPGGGLTTRFGVSIGGCGRVTVQAFGSRGSRARLMPRPLDAQLDCVSPDRGDATDRIGFTT